MRGKPVADVYREAIAKKIAVAKQHDLVVTLAILVKVRFLEDFITICNFICSLMDV